MSNAMINLGVCPKSWVWGVGLIVFLWGVRELTPEKYKRIKKFMKIGLVWAGLIVIFTNPFVNITKCDSPEITQHIVKNQPMSKVEMGIAYIRPYQTYSYKGFEVKIDRQLFVDSGLTDLERDVSGRYLARAFQINEEGVMGLYLGGQLIEDDGNLLLNSRNGKGRKINIDLDDERKSVALCDRSFVTKSDIPKSLKFVEIKDLHITVNGDTVMVLSGQVPFIKISPSSEWVDWEKI